MTRLGETMIDLAWEIGVMMATNGHTPLNDSRMIIDEIKGAAEFELLNWDFDEKDDYLTEVGAWSEKLYQKLLDEKLIGPTPENGLVGWANRYQNDNLDSGYEWGKLYTHKGVASALAEAALMNSGTRILETAIPLYRRPQPSDAALKEAYRKGHEDALAEQAKPKITATAPAPIGYAYKLESGEWRGAMLCDTVSYAEYLSREEGNGDSPLAVYAAEDQPAAPEKAES